ncbi:MAG: phage tail tape measure protein [Burkholderiaceae bacterium]|nr:phage tail tape measure protein [Burkholderiaceae bacterium]
MAIKPIEILIRAKDEFSSMLGSMQTKVAAVAVAIAGFFGILLFSGAVKSAAEFEAAMSRVKAAAGGTDEEFKALKQAAEDAGAATKYTSVQAAGALENLAKAGLNATQAIDTLPAVLALAQAGDVALGTSAEFVTKAVMGMGLQFSDAGRVADVLALGANATNTSVKGLAEALSYAAPTAHSLGLSLETTVAIIGKFADAGIDASRAGTALNSIMSQFSDPASKFRNELAAIGITTGNFNQALHQLADSGARGSKAINAVGLEAGPALKALLNQGMPALDELKAKLDNAAGSAAATAKTMGDNLTGSMTGLGSAWDTVKTVLGTPVLPVLKDGVDQLAGVLRGLVADGTIAKFGESFAEAFRAGIQWARNFFDQIDFKAVVADMQAFAAQAGDTFRSIGENAAMAGNAAQAAYGVMSAGVNAVLAAVYGIGAAFAGVASNIQSGLALLYDAFAKITFGSVSAAYKEAADAIRLSADATMAASQELEKKSTAAFLGVADGAQLARVKRAAIFEAAALR